MRSRWISFALLLVVFHAYSQQNESSFFDYQKALQNKDYFRAGIHLSDIAKFYSNQGNYDSAFIHLKQALKINQEIRNDTMIASNLNDFGILYNNLGFPDSALVYYTKASVIYQKLGNEIGYAYTKVNIAIILKDKGLYERALEQALSAELILEKYPNDNNLDNCYHTIATIYGRAEKPSEALRYHRKALALRNARGDNSGLASTYNNMGNVYKNSARYDSAAYYFEQSLKIKRNLSNKKSTASTLSNLGDMLLRINRVVEAEGHLLESLKIKQSVDDKLGMVTTLNLLGACKILTKDYRIAQQYLDQAEAMEKDMGGLLAEQKSNLELRVRLNRSIKDFKKASDYAEELFLVKDSLLGTEASKKILEVQTKYETESKEQQIEILHAEQELNKAIIQARNFWIAALLLAVVVVLMIAALIYNGFRLARKGRSRVEFLMKELHHRVKNNLQVLSSVLSLQSQSLTDENTLLSIKSTESRINAMALIHRKLYSDNRNTIISTRGYFKELIEFLMSSFGYHTQNLKLNIDIDEIELDVDKAIPLGLIVNELISNAFKHAYGSHENRQLDILVKQYGTELRAVIRDNGKGASEANGEEAKFGMRMVNILVRDLKGKLQTATHNGTEHVVIIPLA